MPIKAIIKVGRNKGKEVVIHQWCNDWFILEDGKIYSPTSIQLNADEIEVFLKSESGIMLDFYSLQIPDGTFKKIRRPHESRRSYQRDA